MKDSKLVKIFKDLSKKEQKEFEKFIQSPYFNTNQNLIGLYEYIMLFAPSFEQEEFTEENALKYVFQEEGNNTLSAITKLTSKLFKLLKQFISVEKHLSNDFESSYNLLLYYREHQYLKEFHALQQQIKKKQKPHSNFFYENFLLERELNLVISQTEDKGVGDVHFHKVSQSLDTYFIYNKLVYACQKINRGQVIKGIETSFYFEDIFEDIPNTPYYQEMPIFLWFQAYQLLTSHHNEEIYFSFKQELFKGFSSLDYSAARLLFTYLENRAIRLFKGEQMYQELFELYDFQDQHSILLHNKTNPNVIKNYVLVALNLNKIIKAEQFLESHKKEILPVFHSHYTLSKALILFEKKEYERTLDGLNELKLQNIYLKLNEKRLRLKIYYHLDYIELLLDTINSFRVFLTNNKEIISDFHLQANKNFINYLSKAVKTVTSIKDNPLPSIEEVQQVKELVERNWLLSVLNN